MILVPKEAEPWNRIERVKGENTTTGRLEENQVIVFIILKFLIIIKYLYHENYFNDDHQSRNYKEKNCKYLNE